MKYTTSFRNSVLKKILPPSNRSVTSVSKETGVAVVTINNWHGLHSEHLPLFRQELNELMTEKVDEKDKRIKELEKQLKETQKELNRKTDALAELAAIYTLKKKLASNHGIMDEEE